MEWYQQKGELEVLNSPLEMWENTQKPDRKPHRSSGNKQNLQEYTKHTTRKIPEESGRSFHRIFTPTYHFPHLYTAVLICKGWQFRPSCLQQTRLITKTLMQCSDLFGCCLRLVSVFHKPKLKLKSSWSGLLLLQGGYIYMGPRTRN